MPLVTKRLQEEVETKGRGQNVVVSLIHDLEMTIIIISAVYCVKCLQGTSIFDNVFKLKICVELFKITLHDCMSKYFDSNF